MELKGVYTALVTPFNTDGTIDEGALREFVEYQISGGVAGLVPMGTTGESPTVSHEENIRVVGIVVEQSAGRVPVIAGTGSNSTNEAIEMTRRARDLGADATLQVTPYYNKPSQEGLYRHFSSVADDGGLPVIIYNIPGRTGKNVENDTTLKLAGHNNIVAVKEASGDINQIMDLLLRRPKAFAVLSGDDNLAFPLVALGGGGVISVASNVIPRQMAEFMQRALSGDLRAAREIHFRLLPLFRALFIDTNPIPVKYALARMGRMKEVYRLPMCEMDEGKKKTLADVLDLLNIG